MNAGNAHAPSIRRRLARLVSTAAMLALPASASAQEAAAPGAATAADLTAGGWIFMLLSNAFVWALTLWCFKRVLAQPENVDPGPAAKP
jgi:hypothetical protein